MPQRPVPLADGRMSAEVIGPAVPGDMVHGLLMNPVRGWADGNREVGWPLHQSQARRLFKIRVDAVG